MSFLPQPGEIQEDFYPYEYSGDEDDRLRQEYEKHLLTIKLSFDILPYDMVYI